MDLQKSMMLSITIIFFSMYGDSVGAFSQTVNRMVEQYWYVVICS